MYLSDVAPKFLTVLFEMATKTEMVRENDFPNYLQMIADVYETCKLNWKVFNVDVLSYPSNFKEDLLRYAHVSSKEIACVFVIGFFLTVVRYILTALVFRVSQILSNISYGICAIPILG